MKIFEILVTIAGIAMSFGYYFQAYQILKAKSSKNISLVEYLIFGFGTLIWLIYGILKNDYIVIFGFVFGVIGSWLVVFLEIKYRRKRHA